MHIHCMDTYRHPHDGGLASSRTESRVRLVMGLTLLCMLGEVVAGWAFGSIALLADGWHMATHGAAMAISLYAFAFARRHSADPSFSFGTGKVDALAGFASAIALGAVSAMMAWESVERLLTPRPIAYGEAMIVAVIGLLVNVASLLILRPHDDHDHGHEHGHGVQGVVLHIMADLATSLGAIAALAGGMVAAWTWLDPVMGLVGAAVIAVWARGLLKDTAMILLDRTEDPALINRIRDLVEADADNRVADLHLWTLRPGHRALILTVVTHYPRQAEHYRALLAPVQGLTHVTIEVIGHQGTPCLPL